MWCSEHWHSAESFLPKEAKSRYRTQWQRNSFIRQTQILLGWHVCRGKLSWNIYWFKSFLLWPSLMWDWKDPQNSRQMSCKIDFPVQKSRKIKEWTNHRIAKSGRFANFLREPGFNLNSPTFSREIPPNSGENCVYKPFRPWHAFGDVMVGSGS